MRDFQYNEEEMKADKEEMTRLSTDKKKQFVRFQQKYFYWCDSIFDSGASLVTDSLSF